MKRFLLGIGIVSIVMVGLAGAGYVVVKYAIDQAGLPVRGSPAPFSHTQLQNMIDAKDAPAASEVSNLVACFDKTENVPDTGTMALGVLATEVLVRIGAPAVEPVQAKLKDKNPRVRYDAVHTLSRLGPVAAPATDDLIARLEDNDADVRRKAAYALGQLGTKDAPSKKTEAIVDGLAKVLDDADGEVSRAAIETMEKIGTPALPKMYVLVGTTKDPARSRMLLALETIGSPPKEALPVLVELVKDSNESVRHPAMKLLAQLGTPAVPTLKNVMKKPSPTDMLVLPHALAKLDAKDAKALLPEVEVMLVENVWWDAEPELMGTLKKCGPDGAQTLVNILKVLHDPKSKQFGKGDARTVIAIRTLGEMGSDAKDAVPTLVELLEDRPALQPNILDALGDIGPAARTKAAPAVEKLLAAPGQNPQVAEKARTALLRMGAIQKKT